jgi:hypothetical protein
MVYFWHKRHFKTETLTAGKTFSEPLPTGGVLDHALAIVRIKNNSAQYSSPEPLILDHITKIEVKGDGKQPFKSYWGQTCLAEYAFAHGRIAPGLLDVMSANYQTQAFPIMMGKRVFDGELGLDLGKPSEVRLEITNDFESDDYDGSTMTLDVDLYFVADPAKPITNFLQTYEKTPHTWTAADQKKVFEVPTEDIVRRIYLGCESARTDPTGAQSNKAWRNLRYLKYTYQSGSQVIKDDDLYRQDQDVLWGYPDKIQTGGLLEARTGYYFDTMLCRPVDLSVVAAYSADPGSTSDIVMDQRVERFLAFRRSAVAGNQARFVAAGYGPYDHLMIREDHIDDVDHYLKAGAEGKKKVEIEVGNSSSGGSSGTIRFVLQTLRAQPV